MTHDRLNVDEMAVNQTIKVAPLKYLQMKKRLQDETRCTIFPGMTDPCTAPDGMPSAVGKPLRNLSLELRSLFDFEFQSISYEKELKEERKLVLCNPTITHPEDGKDGFLPRR